MRKLRKNIPLAIVFWIMTVVMAYLIFSFSCDTGEESAEFSMNFISRFFELLMKYIPHEVFRKIAHFCEFASLGFSLGGSIKFTFDKNNVFYSWIPGILYAVSDEIHQIFVPGRACRAFDVFVDSGGVLTGILVFMLFVLIVEKIMNLFTKKE